MTILNVGLASFVVFVGLLNVIQQGKIIDWFLLASGCVAVAIAISIPA